ncbi:MAG TPA: hypothetical protein VGR25_02000 [bacterium]|nr:hypothetical protein [bacterium]
MSRTVSLFLSALLLLVVGGAVGSHMRASRSALPHPRAAPAPSHSPAQPPRGVAELRDTTLVVRRAGQKQLEVSAERVSISSDQRYAIFSGIVRASLNLRGGLALRLRAPEASWDAARRRLVLPRGIEMEAAGSSIRADRLTLDPDTASLLLEGDVRVTFTLGGDVP